MSTVSFINSKIHTLGDRVAASDRAEALYQWLKEYHAESCTEKRKKEIKSLVLREVFFLFAKSAKGKSSPAVPIDDIISNMAQSTLTAIDKFDPEKSNNFIGYLHSYLKNASATAYKDSFIIKHPMKPRRAAIAKMRKVLEEGNPTKQVTMEEQMEIEEQVRKAAPDVLLTGNGLEALPPGQTPEVKTGMVTAKGYMSVESTGDTACLQGVSSAEHYMLVGEQVHLLAHVLSADNDLLSPREKVVIKHRFGVFGHEKLTLEEVARKFHLRGWEATKNWIFQLEKRALRKIHANFKEHDFCL